MPRNPLQNIKFAPPSWPFAVCAECASRRLAFYWVRNGVWQEAERLSARQLRIVCIPCFEKFLGRQLTLSDLDPQHYRSTLLKNHRFVVQEHLRATIIGACREVSQSTPFGWSEPFAGPHLQSPEIGSYLCRNTPNALEVLPRLVAEADHSFPGIIEEGDAEEFRTLGRDYAAKVCGLIIMGDVAKLAEGLRDSKSSKARFAEKWVEGLAMTMAVGCVAPARRGTGPLAEPLRDGLREGILAAAGVT